MNIQNTGASTLRVNFRTEGKLYNMTTGSDASIASPHPFDTAHIAPGESLVVGGEIVSTGYIPEAVATGVESHVSPEEHAKYNMNGPSE